MHLSANFYLIIHHPSKDNVRVGGRGWGGVAGKCFIIKTSTLDLVQFAALKINLRGNGEGCREKILARQRPVLGTIRVLPSITQPDVRNTPCFMSRVISVIGWAHAWLAHLRHATYLTSLNHRFLTCKIGPNT